MAGLDTFHYILVGTSALFVLFALFYVVYLILDNDEKEFNSRSLGISILFLILASFFSGINFVHYFIERKPFLQFLYEYSAQIGLVVWFALIVSIFHFILEKKFLKTAKEEIDQEIKKIKAERDYLQKDKKRQIEKVQQEAEKIIAEAYQQRERIIEQAEIEREKLLLEAQEEIEREKDRILKRFKENGTLNKTRTKEKNKEAPKKEEIYKDEDEIDLST